MRRTNPVLVVGCPRSGTSLLYSMLESAGHFAVHRAETCIFSLLGPCCGDLRNPRNRARMLEIWEQSDQCTVAGLDMAPVRRRINEECRNTGDFLRIFMENVARHQGAERWAEKTPQHVFFMQEIKRTIPDAQFIHIIRDGRDVAISLAHQQAIRPFPWDRGRSLLVAGLYWQWSVSYGSKVGRRLGADYLEVHYEELINQPQQTLDKIGAFIGQELNYEQILRNGVGEVRRPNTSFASDPNPIGRWRKRITPDELAQLECVIGKLLERCGYPCAAAPLAAPALARMQAAYHTYFAAKHSLKVHTPLTRWMVNLDILRPGAIYGVNRTVA